jgi:hypothetical protein
MVEEILTVNDLKNLPDRGKALQDLAVGKFLKKADDEQNVPVTRVNIDDYGTKSLDENREVNDNIKEISVTLGTDNLGYASYTTDAINGMLEAVIIDTNGIVNVMIYFADMPDIKLFQTKNNYLIGATYLPLRLSALSSDYEKFNFSQEKWCLNNKLTCEVVGTKNSITKITYRYK